MGWRLVGLFLGVFACSTAVILIKASAVHPLLLAGYRQVAAALLLTPLLVRDARRHRGVYGWGHVRRTVLPGLMLAAHFASWTVGARLTTGANASLIVNLVPVVMPFLLWLAAGEVVNRGEIAGTLTAIAGLLILTAGDVSLSRRHASGDLTCLGSMLLFAFYLALARRNRDFPTLWTYVVPLYLVGGVSCFAAAAPVTALTQVFAPREYVFLLGLALVPTIVGHSILNYSLKHMRGQLVSVCNLGQFVFAGIMAFFVFGEVPAANFYLASSLIVLGAVITIRAHPNPAAPSAPRG